MPTSTIRLDETTRAAFAAGRLAHLVTVNPDGSPQASCVYMGWDGDDLVAGHLGDYRKLHNVRRDPRVVVSIEADATHGGLPPYLVVEGTAEVETGGAVEVLRSITSEQLGAARTFPPPGEWPDGFVLRIRPQRIYGVGPWRADVS